MPVSLLRVPAEFRIIEDDLAGDEIQSLLRLHAAGMLDNSPPDACHFLNLEELRRSAVTMWSVWDGGELAGCGGLRELDARHGEVKSMRTDPAHLGRGVGRRLLEHIIESASERGYIRLSLETGRGDSFAAAIGLYTSAGFVHCQPFGEYEDNEFSQFFTLMLPPSG